MEIQLAQRAIETGVGGSNSKFKIYLMPLQRLALIPQPLLPILGEGEPEWKENFPAPSPKLGRGLGRGQANPLPSQNFRIWNCWVGGFGLDELVGSIEQRFD